MDNNNDDDFTPDENAHRKKIDRAALQQDHYATMGLQDLRWAATDAEIKKAYRKMVLLYHPDKLAERGEQGGEETFRGIQKAYDILSDPEKRRDYDSQDAPKDEKYPASEQLAAAAANSSAEFYKMAGDIFRRQGRWSKVEEVPSVGDDSTPIGEVKNFYNWWSQSYESWRTWKHEDEYDLNQAENRNERRWMERQNEKLQRSFKQAEKTAMADFVIAAQKADPRMKKWRDEQQRKKDQKKEYQQGAAEKTRLAEQQAREEEERKAKEAADKEVADKEAAKKNREKEKRRRKEAQKALRTACAKLLGEDEKVLTAENVEIVAGAAQLTVEDLRALTKAISDKGKEAIESHFAPALRDVKMKRSGSNVAGKGNDNNNNNNVAEAVSAAPWTLDELSHLARATNKFPGGFTDRWDHIMNDLKHFGIHRSLADVQAHAVELKKGKQASLVVDEDQVNRDIIKKVESNKLEAAPSQNYNAVAGDPSVWTNTQMKQLQDGLQAVPKDADKRFEMISAKFVPGKTAEQCQEKFKALVAIAKQKSAAAASAAGPKTAVAQALAEEWTLEQQKQLEHGLKTVAADDPWRWDKISAGVTGKNRKQVVDRYNELVQRLKKK